MDKLESVPVMVDYPSEWLDRALSITGRFEGCGYDNVTGNFDGMGISAGILQWCIGQGSLQLKILKPYITLHGSINKLGIFPGEIMDQLAVSTVESGLRLVTLHMLQGKRIKNDWSAAWKKFLVLPAVIEIQKMACEDVAMRAIRHCRDWDMVTPRAFCWFFDLITQNGGLKGVKKPTVDHGKVMSAISFASKSNTILWGTKAIHSNEQAILLIASHERALLARAAYMKDVMDRKGTIAMDIGYVHGDKFDLSTK